MSAGATIIEALTQGHWPDVARIYAEGIETGDATFEEGVPSWEEWDAAHLSRHRFVARRDGTVIGWVAASSVSDRCVFGGVVESSVYVARDHRGGGVGQALLEALIESTEAADIWTVQAGIFPENLASLALHERVGFEVIGRRKRLGKLNGVWRDVLLLERRSEIIE
jgi:phosphinothricin acetyltransferase